MRCGPGGMNFNLAALCTEVCSSDHTGPESMVGALGDGRDGPLESGRKLLGQFTCTFWSNENKKEIKLY